MSKKYTRQDILDMAVRLKEQDMAADMDRDGKITPEDARLAPDGVEVPDPATELSRTLLDRLMNEKAFGYDFDADPLYRQYRDMYETAGGRAAENAYGLASSYTGGYGSSYAATAANDAYALYMDKLAAKGAELEQKAYDRYRDARTDLYKQYAAAGELEDRQYARDRDMKEDFYRDEALKSDQRSAALKEKEAERSSLNDAVRFAFDAAGQGDYSYLAALGVDTSALTRKDALAAAETYAKYGDLSGLEKLGVDVSPLTEKEARDKAAFYADYGDLSGLKKLGVDVSALQAKNAEDKAAFYARYGDLSGLTRLGVDVSRLKKEQLYDVAALFARYGNYSLLRLLV